jgi:hypothetical protein
MENKKNLYEETLRKLRDNKSKRLSGEIIAIPWNLPRLNRVLPGIEPEKIIVCTAGPKIGKSQLANFLYVFQPIDYLFEHPECNLDIKIFYFSLEISKEAIMRQAISYRLFSKYGVVISPQKLLSVYTNYILDDKIESLIEQEKPWFNFLESKIDLQDEIRGATAIFKYVENYFEANGIWTYKNITIDKEIQTVRDRYSTNHPNLIVEVISDHLGLLPAEGALDQRETIGRFSSIYSLRLRDKYKACVIHVQQQALMGSQQQFTNSGKSIIEKLKPEVGNLANNKEVSRDVNLMLGLFAPNKFGFDSYKDYDLNRLQDNHRELIIMLNRDGISGKNLDLYFQGASGYFSELPRPEDIKESDYLAIESIRNKTI